MDNEEHRAEEYGLNLRLVDAGPATSVYAMDSSDCTTDNCGSGNTDSDACSGGAGD